MTTKPNTRERCSPNCSEPVGFVVRDADELRPEVLCCLVHLGKAVGMLVGRYGAVTVERTLR